MRELQFAGHAEGLETQYADIEELITTCRFKDCSHVTENNCAILDALQEDRLDPSRWKSYKKIAGEIRHEMRKENKSTQAINRKVWRKGSMDIRKKNRGW